MFISVSEILYPMILIVSKILYLNFFILFKGGEDGISKWK